MRAINIGEAAHITAAAEAGPRYDRSLTEAQRSSIDNAIWLCAACATLIDRDEDHFSVPVLRQWRERAEQAAARDIAAGSKYRPIAANELQQEMTLGELLAVKEMEEEFGCHVETRLHVPMGEGFIRLDAAVVRGEDLVAIEIRENRMAYFQVEYMLELCAKEEFPRFRSCAVYLVVVSDGPLDAEAEVRQRLQALADASSVETYVRMFRLNTLRAKHGM